MQFIESPSTNAYFNMALEEYVFESLPRNQAYFMLWQNKNAVVVGKYQNTAEEIDAAFVKKQGIDVVRRLSGGGAMYQDMGNLNFTFVVDQKGEKKLDFEVFTRPVVQALSQMGVQAQTGSRNDILIEGKKFSGNSQYNKNGRTMHHGTLLFCSNLGMIAQALTVKPDKIESKGVKSVRSRVTNIADHLPAPVNMQTFKHILREAMFAQGQLYPYTLTRADIAAVKALQEKKYATWEWNYGRSPAYSIRKQRRYPFGGVSLFINVQSGRLAQVSFAGDFFGNGNIADLQEALQGQPLEQAALAERLKDIDVGFYIKGMDAQTLAELLAL